MLKMLPFETSDEYCFSSLYAVSPASSDYLFDCNHFRNGSNTQRVYTHRYYRFEPL